MTELSYPFDLLCRKHHKFVLWIPGSSIYEPTPQLVLGTYDGSSELFTKLVHQPLIESAHHGGLWELDPAMLYGVSLKEDTVYYYWFEVEDTSPERIGKLLVTDPLAYTVDYRLASYAGRQQPASVIKYRDKKLWPTSIDGQEPQRLRSLDKDDLEALPSNNQLVIYELPASWVKAKKNQQGVEFDFGTFADVTALFDKNSCGRNFSQINEVGSKRAILLELGVNAVELLPAADAKPNGEWGYATAHYFAPDANLGSSVDLVELKNTLSAHSVRLISDTVMAFGHDPYRHIDYRQFHIRPRDEPNNGDSKQSGNNGGALRDGWGGESWRYIQSADGYDPQTGTTATVTPSWEFHNAQLTRWMLDFGLDGLRLDSVNNIGSWNFVKSFKNLAWKLYKDRPGCENLYKFLVIGEELSMPGGMLSGYLDSLWNEPWQERVRAVILGKGGRGDSFVDTVRKMVDCTLDTEPGFTDGAQAVNYITSHDVEGYHKERLFNYLLNNNIVDGERRAKLAFVCLLTSVGIPMIFAGEEFCDIHDRPMSEKQTDPVNYARMADDWRQRVFQYVSRLVKFRTKSPALGVDDNDFFHIDWSRDGKVMAWKRGGKKGQAPVVVVANFSDTDTPGSDYYIPNWPERNRDDWREITQSRNVPREWIGREPLMHWEAKVYTFG
jgi:pullulanase